MKIKSKNSRRAAETQSVCEAGGNPHTPSAKPTPKNLCVSASLRENNTPAPVEPEVLPPLGKIEEPDYTKPDERIRFHLGMGQHHGRLAIAHIILAGWELSKQKDLLGYGGWRMWCEKNLSMSYKTADRYIEFFVNTVGAVRAERQIPFANRVTNKELDVATVGMEEKSARQAMIDLNIIKRAKWGGDRRDKAAENGHTVGRKPKDAAKAVTDQLDEIANSETLVWSVLKGALDTLVKLDAERDVWRRLSDEHLSSAVAILADMAKKSSEAMMRRIGK